VISCLGQPQQIIGGHAVKLRQLDNGIVAGVQVNLSKSALGSYEAKDFKDISHYAIIKLAKFYGVTADYLLGLSQTSQRLQWRLHSAPVCQRYRLHRFQGQP